MFGGDTKVLVPAPPRSVHLISSSTSSIRLCTSLGLTLKAKIRSGTSALEIDFSFGTMCVGIRCCIERLGRSIYMGLAMSSFMLTATVVAALSNNRVYAH